MSSIHLRGYALVDWPDCVGERGTAISGRPAVGCEKRTRQALLISSSLLRLSLTNYDKHIVCQPTLMNVAGLKPYDDLPPPLPPPKIVEEKSRLPPVPLDTTDLMPSSLNPNGLYPPTLSFVFYSVSPLSPSSTPELTTPVTPTSTGGSRSQPPSPQPEARSKKTNPLTELVETEKIYVDQLAGIIRVRPTGYFYSVPPECSDGLSLIRVSD